MNEVMEDYIKDGLGGLAKLLAGKHLRPTELASTIVSVCAAPDAAADIVLGFGKQLPLEEPNGTSETNGESEIS